GFPTETMYDIELTKRFIYKLNSDSLLVKIYVPYPGSSLYDYVVKNKLFTPPEKLEDWAISWTEIHYQLSEVAPDVLNHLVDRIIFAHYLKKFPRITLSFLKNLLSHKISLPKMLSYGIKTFLARNN
ncbi:MAG: hypothetical protein HWN66_18675, partial [Candidatus Helarchaeota archaeon]|nr:hypothetical protein [Candidatus Helarchaeota archaeon]